jgi:hypothetical protein
VSDETLQTIEDGITIALLRLTPKGIEFAWLSHMFLIDSPVLDPEIRKDIVEKLRFYATKLENGELDERMKLIGAALAGGGKA